MESIIIANIIFMVINAFILGYVISRAAAIPKERDIIKGIMEAKVPISMNPNLIPPGTDGVPKTPKDFPAGVL